MSTVDEAIIDTYRVFDTPADQLLLNRERSEGFVDAVSRLANAALESDWVLHRLLTMRKKGQLPRLRR